MSSREIETKSHSMPVGSSVSINFSEATVIIMHQPMALSCKRWRLSSLDASDCFIALSNAERLPWILAEQSRHNGAHNLCSKGREQGERVTPFAQIHSLHLQPSDFCKFLKFNHISFIRLIFFILLALAKQTSQLIWISNWLIGVILGWKSGGPIPMSSRVQA